MQNAEKAIFETVQLLILHQGELLRVSLHLSQKLRLLTSFGKSSLDLESLIINETTWEIEFEKTYVFGAFFENFSYQVPSG